MHHLVYTGTLSSMIRALCKISITSVVVILAYLSLFRGNFDHIADDPGLGWHLANGAHIASTGSVSDTDPFLAQAKLPNPHASVGQPRTWINEQWLSDLILFKLFLLGGWPLLYGVVAGLFLLAYFGIAGDGLPRAGQGGILILLAIIFAFKLSQVQLILRPVIFSIVLFPLVLGRMHRLMTRIDISWLDIRREMLPLGLTFVLWANLHPAFVYGLCIMGIGIIAQLLRGQAGLSSAVRCATLAALCFCATLCNPFGLSLYESIAHLGGSSYLRSLTIEWYPVDLSRPEGALLMILVLVPALVAMASSEIRKRLVVFDVLVALFFVQQALWAVRVLPFASFACLPLWATCFDGLSIVPKHRSFVLTGRVLSSLMDDKRSGYAIGLKSSLVTALFGLLLLTSFPERLLPADLGSIHERRLAKIFANVDTARTEGVVFASPDWGGAITHLFGPRYKPVYDDRTVVVGEGLYRAYAESFQQPSTFQRLVTTFGITHVLIPSGIDMASYLRQQSGWKEGDSVDGYSLFSVK
jgi:hypothetical protein